MGIISNNRWEWAAIAAASYSLSATLVPMYEAQLPKDWSYIINDSDCSVLFCSTRDISDRVRGEVLPSAPTVVASLCLDGRVGDEGSFSTAMDRAERRLADYEGGGGINGGGADYYGGEGGAGGEGATIAARSSFIAPPLPEDLANLIYTSGTTGKPKGVETLHSNVVSNVKGVRGMVPPPEVTTAFIPQSDRTLAFLPWAHCYGQTCELWTGMAHGCSMGVGRGVPDLLEDLTLVRPTVLFAVPTLYKRIYDGVHNAMANSSDLKRKLMTRALGLGRKNADHRNGIGSTLNMMERAQFYALDSIVLSKIRGRFGGTSSARHVPVSQLTPESTPNLG